MKTSCVRHPTNHPLVMMRKWQIEACDGDHCAAMLLAFFEYGHNGVLEHRARARRSNNVAEMHGDPRSQDESLFQPYSEEDLIAALLEHYGESTIRKGVRLLEKKGFITIHKNPNPRYAFDKARFFRFHPDIAQEWLDRHYPTKPAAPAAPPALGTPENANGDAPAAEAEAEPAGDFDAFMSAFDEDTPPEHLESEPGNQPSQAQNYITNGKNTERHHVPQSSNGENTARHVKNTASSGKNNARCGNFTPPCGENNASCGDFTASYKDKQSTTTLGAGEVFRVPTTTQSTDGSTRDARADAAVAKPVVPQAGGVGFGKRGKEGADPTDIIVASAKQEITQQTVERLLALGVTPDIAHRLVESDEERCAAWAEYVENSNGTGLNNPGGFIVKKVKNRNWPNGYVTREQRTAQDFAAQEEARATQKAREAQLRSRAEEERRQREESDRRAREAAEKLDAEFDALPPEIQHKVDLAVESRVTRAARELPRDSEGWKARRRLIFQDLRDSGWLDRLDSEDAQAEAGKVAPKEAVPARPTAADMAVAGGFSALGDILPDLTNKR